MKRFLSLFMILVMLPMTAHAHGDMPSDWAEEDIMTITESGIIYMDRFHYFETPITRMEYAYLMYQLYEHLTGQPILAIVDLSADNGFTDFIEDSENEDDHGFEFSSVDNLYLKALKAAGLITGYPDGSYGPDDYITREELMVLYARVLEKSGYGLTMSNHVFADEESISDWAYDSVMKCYELGLVKGVGDNHINPKGYATIEESFVVLSRIISNSAFSKQREAGTGVAGAIVSDGKTTASIRYDVFGQASGISLYDDFSYIGQVPIKEGIKDQGLYLTQDLLYFWSEEGKLQYYSGGIMDTGFMTGESVENWYIENNLLHFSLAGKWAVYDMTEGSLAEETEKPQENETRLTDGTLFYQGMLVAEDVTAYDSGYGKVYYITGDGSLYSYDSLSEKRTAFADVNGVELSLNWNYLAISRELYDESLVTIYVPAFDLGTYLSAEY